MTDCPFCAYADGDAEPENRFSWWDAEASVMAFRPLHPFAPGHLLVCPMEHVESVLDATPATISAVMQVVQAIGAGMAPGTAQGVDVVTSVGRAATQPVMHWHVHLIPRWDCDELGAWPWEPPCQHTLG